MKTLQSIKMMGLSAGVFALILLLTGCSNFFGSKTELDFITPPDYSGRKVNYLPILPDLTGFAYPTQVYNGKDQLIYVVDSGRQEIVSLDQSGRRLGTLSIPGLRAVAQDRNLDLIALGKENVSITVGSEVRTFNLATISRIGLKNNVYGLSQATVIKKIYHKFYNRANANVVALDEKVTFNGVAILPDNRYLITRSSAQPDPAATSPIDAVLLFNANDILVSPLNINGDGGASFSDFFRKPYAIATIPPKQSFISPLESQDFLVTTLDTSADNVLKVKYIETDATEEGVNYGVKLLPGNPGNIRTLYDAGLFVSPKGIAVANDESGYIFVTDQDSLFQFTPEGYEGVKLRGSRINTGYNRVSFGGTGSGPYQFKNIAGVAYQSRIVYIADAGNGRVVRYKLSTDFE